MTNCRDCCDCEYVYESESESECECECKCDITIVKESKKYTFFSWLNINEYLTSNDDFKILFKNVEDLINLEFKKKITEYDFDPNLYYYENIVAPIEEDPHLLKVKYEEKYDKKENMLSFQNRHDITDDEFMEKTLAAIDYIENEDNINGDDDDKKNEKIDKLMKNIYDFTEEFCEIIDKKYKFERYVPGGIRMDIVKYYSEIFELNQFRDHMEARIWGRNSLREKIYYDHHEEKRNINNFEENVDNYICNRTYKYDNDTCAYTTFIENNSICVIDAIQLDETIYKNYIPYKKATVGNVNNIPIANQLTFNGSEKDLYSFYRMICRQKYGVDTMYDVTSVFLMESLKFYFSSLIDCLESCHDDNVLNDVRIKNINIAHYRIRFHGVAIDDNNKESFFRMLQFWTIGMCNSVYKYYSSDNKNDYDHDCDNITDNCDFYADCDEEKVRDKEYYSKILYGKKVGEKPELKAHYYNTEYCVNNNLYTYLIKTLKLGEIIGLIKCNNDLIGNYHYNEKNIPEILLISKIAKVFLSVYFITKKEQINEKHLIILAKNKSFISDVEYVIDRIGRVNVRNIELKYGEKELLYHCYFTMDKTKKTGGHTFYLHRSKNGEVCCPNYVIHPDAFKEMTSGAKTINKTKTKKSPAKISCPICQTRLDPKFFTTVQPKKIHEEKSNSPYNFIKKTENKVKTLVLDLDSFGENGQNGKNGKNDGILNLLDLDFNIDYTTKISFKDYLIFANPSLSKQFVMCSNVNIVKNNFIRDMPKFLNHFDFKKNNIVIAGGLCRSLLLGQKINDIDFFFTIPDESEIQKNIINVINDMIIANKNVDPDMKFILMYKPQFKVIEILCIKETEKKDVTKKTKIKPDADIDPDLDSDLDSDSDSESESKTEQSHPELNEDQKFKKFCDNNLVYTIQIIIKAYDSVKAIFDDFDMYPSCVAFDGENILFNHQSHMAYKYMINVINKKEMIMHDLFNMRVKKYNDYGFAVCINKNKMPEQFLNKLNVIPRKVMISNLAFTFKHHKKRRSDDDYFPITKIELNKKNNYAISFDLYCTNTDDRNCNHDIKLINKYEFVKNNNINYCFLSHPILNLDDVSDVIKSENMEFTTKNTFGEHNDDWYDPSKIYIY